MELKCPKCGVSYGKEDLFCRKCGVRLQSAPKALPQGTQVETEVIALLKTLKEFRVWIDQKKRKDVRFIRAYKERIEQEIGPPISELAEKYREREEGQSSNFSLIMDAFLWLSRPITIVETRLRPSVGMGVFLERWMVTKVFEDYLKECCHEADHHLDELTKKISSSLRGID